MSRKSQMEIMGLAVIVILALIGMFFAMKYLMKAPEKRYEASDRQIAVAFLNSMLADKLEIAECKQGLEFKEMVQDCTEQKDELKQRCSGNTPYCDMAKKVTEQLLKKTFDERKQKYEFRLGTSDKKEPMWKHGDCGASEEKVQVAYPIPTRQGTVSLVLYMCH